jgi:nucleoside-diphosphate-sugar epimerase
LKKKLNIGITGSTGSLGKHFLKFKSNYRFIKFKDDIRSKTKIKAWFKKNNFYAIFHLAAIVPIKLVNKNKKKALDVNYNGTKNLVDEILKNNIHWFFFSSTSHVYNSSYGRISENSKANPISYYGKTKLLAEKYIVKKLNKSNIKFCIARIFSTTNRDQKKNYLVPDLKYKIKNSKKNITLSNLNHYRDFISMQQICKITFHLLKKKFCGTINLGTGKKIHLKKIAIAIAKKFGKKITFIDENKKSYLIANNTKLKKIYKIKLNTKINDLIL